MGELTRTVKGNVVHFKDIVSEPITDIKLYFTPMMSGFGEQSPTNVRPFVPTTYYDMWHCGKNIFSAYNVVTNSNHILNDSGAETYTSGLGYTENLTQVCGNDTYTLSGTLGAWRIYYFNENEYFISRTDELLSTPYTFTTPSNCKFIALQYTMADVDFDTVQIEHGHNATEYMPFSGDHTTNEIHREYNDDVVYGGYIDLATGEVVATYRLVTLNDPNKWKTSSGSGIPGAGNVTLYYDEVFSDRYKDGDSSYTNIECSYAPLLFNRSPMYARWSGASANYFGFTVKDSSYTLETVQAAASNGDIQICYLLAQPVYTNLSTSISIPSTLNGSNSIWNTCGGQTEVTYCVHDTMEIAARKAMLINQPHKETVSGGRLVNFKTDIVSSLVVHTNSQSSFTRVGKNLYDNSRTDYNTDWWISGSTGSINYETGYGYVSSGWIDVVPYRGKLITLNKGPGGGNPGIAFYTDKLISSFITGSPSQGTEAGIPIYAYVPENANYMRFCTKSNINEIQIEVGYGSTSYEPYTSESNIASPMKSRHGVNNIYIDSEDGLSIDFWTRVRNVQTIGGIPVLIDNASYAGGNMKFDAITEDKDYFIAGPFDSGSTASKSYTVVGLDATRIRLYNDINATSKDWWTYTSRTFSSVGRYITCSVKKSNAANYSIYSNAQGKYLMKGDNVT